jgi:hypothetical protein
LAPDSWLSPLTGHQVNLAGLPVGTMPEIRNTDLTSKAKTRTQKDQLNASVGVATESGWNTTVLLHTLRLHHTKVFLKFADSL